MARIIVAMPRIEDAKKMSELLRSHGTYTVEICTTGSHVLAKAHELEQGVVICTRNFKDMYCSEIIENLPEYFAMLLLTSKEGLDQCPQDVVTVTMPFRMSDLLSSLEMLLIQLERRIRKEKKKPKKRTKEEQMLLDEAKQLLMCRNHMTEQEAFRYIQKCSMDSCTNMIETAQMILLLQRDV